jgi:hypothetical protein
MPRRSQAYLIQSFYLEIKDEAETLACVDGTIYARESGTHITKLETRLAVVLIQTLLHTMSKSILTTTTRMIRNADIEKREKCPII